MTAGGSVPNDTRGILVAGDEGEEAGGLRLWQEKEEVEEEDEEVEEEVKEEEIGVERGAKEEMQRGRRRVEDQLRS